MTTADIENIYDGTLAEENLLLFIAEGETHSSKLGSPKIVQITSAAEQATSETGTYWQTYADGWHNATISGKTITFHTTAGGGSAHNGAGSACYVTIYGRL